MNDNHPYAPKNNNGYNNGQQYQQQAPKQPPRQKIQTFIEDDDFEMGEACRETVRLKIGCTGPSGSGKTLGALLLASGLVNNDWSKVAFLDTENRSGAYYVGRDFDYKTKEGTKRVTIGRFIHVPISEHNYDNEKYPFGPYDPRRFVAAIHSVRRRYPDLEVLIIDSGTHEWDGLGGCLDIQSKLGGTFQDWAKVTPMHKAFIDAMRDAPFHVIMTMRSKQDYVIEQNEKGKQAPRKVGTKATQREGTDYEFGLVFDVTMEHRALASKDRTGIFANLTLPFQLTPAVGRRLLTWANDSSREPVIVVDDNTVDAQYEDLRQPAPQTQARPQIPEKSQEAVQSGGNLEKQPQQQERQAPQNVTPQPQPTQTMQKQPVLNNNTQQVQTPSEPPKQATTPTQTVQQKPPVITGSVEVTQKVAAGGRKWPYLSQRTEFLLDAAILKVHKENVLNKDDANAAIAGFGQNLTEQFAGEIINNLKAGNISILFPSTPEEQPLESEPMPSNPPQASEEFYPFE